jgi:hypothetical protein
MKLIITENQKDIVLKKMIKSHGVWVVASMVGVHYLVDEVFNGDPNEFLSLYEDLNRYESKENPDIFLYRYDDGDNVFVSDERDDDLRSVYVNFNYDTIFKFLGMFKPTQIMGNRLHLLRIWLRDKYDVNTKQYNIDTFHPDSEDEGFYAKLR